MADYFTAADGAGDMTLWVDSDNPFGPDVVLRYVDLPLTARVLWPIILEAVDARERVICDSCDDPVTDACCGTHCGDLDCFPRDCAEDEWAAIRADEQRAYEKENGHR